MKTNLLFTGLLILISISSTYSQGTAVATDPEPNTYTQADIKQSTMHDAIQYYYARNGLTFYFRRLRLQGQLSEHFEIIDLVNHKNLGNAVNFAEELKVKPDGMGAYDEKEIMDSFLKKYNGKFKYVMGNLSEGDDKTDEMCTQIMKEILKRNANIRTDEKLTEKLDSAYKANTYFDFSKEVAARKTMNATFVSQITGKAHSTFDDNGGAGSLAGNLGKGAAKFLIERANQEINAAFFRRLKKVMDDTQELQKLFPNVYSLTSKIESYNFDAALNALKTKLEEDLENILSNIPTLGELEKYQQKLNEVPELTYFFAVCDVMSGLKDDKNVAGILHKIYRSPYVVRPITNHANVLQLAGLLSFSLRDVMLCDQKPEEKGWISPTELAYKEDVALEIGKYYLGFLAQVDPGIVIRLVDVKGTTTEIKLGALIISKKNDYAKLTTFINSVYNSLEQIGVEITTIKKLSENESETQGLISTEKFEHYKNIALGILDIADATLEFPGLFNDEQKKTILATTSDFRVRYIPAAEQAVGIAANIEKKNYNEAVYDAGELVSLLLQKVDNDNATKISGKIFQYGQFFATVATAENGDQVKEAINAIALPTGSSSLKKELLFNIAVNGYIGYFNRQLKKDDKFVTGFTQSYGITAPIGFTTGFGFRKGGSLSLFTGILDVGAIAQYELKTDPTSGATTAEPEIDWGNILSPSIQVVYGFPWYLPVSAGVGYQWLANTASVKSKDFELTPRVNFFIAFDIPILNVVSVKRQKK
jgi:hypothetical protein